MTLISLLLFVSDQKSDIHYLQRVETEEKYKVTHKTNN